jgi:hypothetical protein
MTAAVAGWTDPRHLLALWEQALPLPPAARDALLAGAPEAPSVGVQHRRLLEVLARQGSSTLSLRCHCPACAEAAEVSLVPAALLQALPDTAPAPEHTLDDGDWQLRFRLPAPGDLQALDGEADVERFVQRLLQRCLIEARHAGRPLDTATAGVLPAGVSQRLSERMASLDAAATLMLAVDCPSCGHGWPALFDPGLACWTLLQTQAEQWLLDVDMLAQRYGWSEDQILALNPVRRQAYLQLAQQASADMQG